MNTKEILQYVLEYNGITLDFPFSQFRKIDHGSGYLVGIKEYTHAIHLNHFCIETIETYAFKNKAILEHDGNKYLGIWIDKTSGIVYLDISIHIKELEQALNLARSNKQLAIWDCANKAEIKVI